MQQQQSNNKRIAKNTVLLYVRMLFGMAITFYTSRVILDKLGVEDFGIYGVVGGVISMFTFLSSSMAGSTSRFLTFELGTKNFGKLKRTFSAALTIHILLAFVILVLSETIGLWWLENKLVISEDRMNAARWVYQISIAISMIGIIQVPFNASLISHERMNVFAYIEILNSTGKLLVAYLLSIGDFDKLILYTILTFCVAILVFSIYCIYCYRNFSEVKFELSWDKNIITPLLGFSKWNVLGTLAYTSRTQGLNILLNLFYGITVNAAFGIASQVQNAIQSFSSSLITASQPQIIKLYAKGDIDNMQNLIFNVSKFSFLLLSLISVPLIIENNFVLHLWLKKVPDFAVIFSQLNLVAGLLTGMFMVFTIANFAVGKLRLWSIITSIIHLAIIPISYIFLKLGNKPFIPFIFNIILLFIGYFCSVLIFKYHVPKFSIRFFLRRVFLVCVIILLLSLVIPLYIHNVMDYGWTRFLAVFFSLVFLVIIFTFYFGISKIEKKKIISILNQKINK